MSDDQDGCEWVNVPSGTGVPGIVPDKGPLNGCVCMCGFQPHGCKMNKSFRICINCLPLLFCSVL